MEKEVFPLEPVHAELEQFVRVRLYTDGQDAASKKNQRLQEKTFDTVGIPLYTVLTPDGKPVAVPGPDGALTTYIAGIQPSGTFAGFLRTARERATQTAVAKE